MRGGNRVVLTPEDGVRLNVTDPDGRERGCRHDRHRTGPGQTKVVADFGGQKAEAVLNVTPGVAGVPTVAGVDVVTRSRLR